MRVVYSFSVPDNSIAHWQLKKWKAAGERVSGLLQKLIEGEGSQVLHQEKQLAQLAEVMGRQEAILEALGTQNDHWRLSKMSKGWGVHGAVIHSKRAAHIVEKAIEIEKYHTSKEEEE